MTPERPRIGLVVQCTPGDLYASRDPEDYVIAIAKRSGLFDEIVLAVPDLPESAVFDRIGEMWDVRVVKGPVYDVASRILLAAERHRLDVLCRVLLRRFYMDVDLVRDMVKMLTEEGADYVRLPVDFNYELGADVFTRDALARAIAVAGDDPARRFSPWRVLDEYRQTFAVLEHRGSAAYDRPRVAAIKSKLGRLLSENQVHQAWEAPMGAYAHVVKSLKSTDVVLDIACGKGEGSRRLRTVAKRVVGVDLDAQFVAAARAKFAAVDGLEYIAHDAMTYSAPGTYDAIVSLHTLEHLPDAPGFLARCRENLRPGGRLVLEVPLLLPRPLGEPLYPYHVKEYGREELLSIVRDTGLKIEAAMGRDRGVYVDFRSARESLHLHCVSS